MMNENRMFLIELMLAKHPKIKQFFRFLKENDVYDRYICYTFNQAKTNFTQSFINCDLDYKMREIINLSFIWDKTKEKRKFWESLHYSWVQKYN